MRTLAFCVYTRPEYSEYLSPSDTNRFIGWGCDWDASGCCSRSHAQVTITPVRFLRASSFINAPVYHGFQQRALYETNRGDYWLAIWEASNFEGYASVEAYSRLRMPASGACHSQPGVQREPLTAFVRIDIRGSAKSMYVSRASSPSALNVLIP